MLDNPVDYNVEIKDSPIHGKGVFTLVSRKSGDMIMPYVYLQENVMKHRDFIKQHGRDFRYTYSNRRTWEIINVKENRNVITYINDNTPDHNCVLKNKRLYAIRDIEQGEELTLSYPHYQPKSEIEKMDRTD